MNTLDLMSERHGDNLFMLQEEQGFFRTRKFHGEDSNLDLFSTNLGLDFEDDNGT